MTKTLTSNTFFPPVMEARRWLADMGDIDALPLINVSQAAPVDPPPEGLRRAMADALMSKPETHLYGPVLGNDALRDQVAQDWSASYNGTVKLDNVAITSGCNQAFCATIAMLCDKQDEVILPTPWYFNHKMWLDMAGVRSVPLDTGDTMLPDPDAAKALVTDRTRAIVLVTPNNPTGLEYPADLIRAFYEMAQAHGIKLVIDETYRDFLSRDGAPHDLFTDPEWSDTLIQLYSFSKAYRLTGHRVGAMIASAALLAEAEKFLDTVTICPAQTGQIGALWGMQNLQDWLASERKEIIARAKAIRTGAPALTDLGWKLKGAGAYFAYFEHPFDMPSNDLAREMVRQQHVLSLPGTMFTPDADPLGASHLRIAFANIDAKGIADMYDRLKTLRI